MNDRTEKARAIVRGCAEVLVIALTEVDDVSLMQPKTRGNSVSNYQIKNV